MRIRHLALAVALMLFSFISASAAPKIDRELSARLAVAGSTTKFGVISLLSTETASRRRTSPRFRRWESEAVFEWSTFRSSVCPRPARRSAR